MSVASLRRIGAVARADLVVRLRRPSTSALFLLLCVMAYGMVPAPSTGRTLVTRGAARALYNSATIAIATAGLASVLLGLLGYYLISSAIRRDVVTRVGSVIAAMPVRSSEYLAGKLAGNIAFLAVVTLAYLLNVMVMHLLIGETPLQPLVYLGTYAAILGPAIVVYSAVALAFECVRPLSGRVGDVLYFFVWTIMIAASAIPGAADASAWLGIVDITGLRFLIDAIAQNGSSRDLAIGATAFDPTLPVWVFPGLPWSWSLLATRAAPMLLALPLFAIARLGFHRFDPARVKAGAQQGRGHPLAWLNRALKPASRAILPLLGAGTGAARIAISESWLTFALSPLALVGAVVVAGWSLIAPLATLRSVVLPAAFLAIVAAIAEIATRDDTAGVRALAFSMPGVRRARVRTQILSAGVVTLAYLFVPLLRLAVADPPAALSLVIGGAFVGAAAVAGGALTGGPKAFIGCFLLFFYIVMNGRGVPAFDFAGWSGAATSSVRLGYAAVTVVLIALAASKERLAPAA